MALFKGLLCQPLYLQVQITIKMDGFIAHVVASVAERNHKVFLVCVLPVRSVKHMMDTFSRSSAEEAGLHVIGQD